MVQFSVNWSRAVARHPDERPELPAADVRVGRLMAWLSAVVMLLMAAALGGLGAVLVAQQLPERQWLPVAIGIIFVVGAGFFVAAATSYVRDSLRWDAVRTLPANLVALRSRRRDPLARYVLFADAIPVFDCSTLRRIDVNGLVRLVRGQGQLALLIDARGRRFLGALHVAGDPIPWSVLRTRRQPR